MLRPLDSADAPRIRELAGAAEVAAMTLRIPHPYPEGLAEAWIGTQPVLLATGRAVTFGVMVHGDPALCGCVGIELEALHRRGEIGYWLGVGYWNRGYATEAVTAATEFAFSFLNLERITALCFAENAASLRVLEKCGFRREGVLRRHILKNNVLCDVVACGLLREEHRRVA